MAFEKHDLLDKTIELVKEYVRGGGKIPPEVVLRDVFAQLNKLNEETK